MIRHTLHFSSVIYVLASLGCVRGFDPCPLLGPNFPPPTALDTSSTISSATSNLKALFDDAVRTGNSSNGPFSNETTSFSVALFTAPSAASNSLAQDSFFWQYHYTAPTLKNATSGVNSVDADSIYRIGSLTQVFNIWTLLANTGERYLHQPVTDFVKELAQAAHACSSSDDPLHCVDWSEVTLRELGSHLSGIGRDYGFGDLIGHNLPICNGKNSSAPVCGIDPACSRAQFFEGFVKRAPVFAPGTTPIASDAAFQILGYALESITGKSFADILHDSILSPLGVSSIALAKPSDNSRAVLPNTSLWSTDLGDLSSSLGLYSNLRDLSTAGQAMISSRFLKPAQTRRWLKPVSQTSNLVNNVGMPWQLYSAVSDPTDPIIDTYTYLGGLGAYSSYLGLVPNYNVGFAILAADSAGSTPDLNAHADFIAGTLLPALETVAATEAIKGHAGTYSDAASGAKLSIAANYTKTGLNVLSFTGSNGTDLKATLAELNNVSGGADALSFRLFPTNLATDTTRSFRAVYQDMNAFADAGTPTCVSWMNVDQLMYGGKSLDSFNFNYKDGQAVSLEVPGFGLKLVRTGA